MSEKALVFVYGTLKRGHGNHRLLVNAGFLGEHTTTPDFTMHDLGAFPGVCLNGKHSIKGEIYLVDEDEFLSLDRLEGFPHFYNRTVIETEYGDAWMYCLRERQVVGRDVVENGEW